MIIDKLVQFLAAVIDPVINLIPVATISLPGASSVSDALCKMNTFLPILGPLTLAVTILAAVGAFIGLRLVLATWNAIKP